MSSLLKNFAKVVDLEARQVLVMKTERTEEEREEDKECDDHPYLLEARYYLLDGTTLSELKLSFAKEKQRDAAFDNIDAETVQGLVNKTNWMEEILLNSDDEDDEDLDDWDDPDYFGEDDDES